MANKNDTIEERVFAENNRKKDRAGALQWLGRNMEDPQAGAVIKKLGLGKKELDALNFVKENPGRDGNEDVYEKILNNMSQNEAKNSVIEEKNFIETSLEKGLTGLLNAVEWATANHLDELGAFVGTAMEALEKFELPEDAVADYERIKKSLESDKEGKESLKTLKKKHPIAATAGAGVTLLAGGMAKAGIETVKKVAAGGIVKGLVKGGAKLAAKGAATGGAFAAGASKAQLTKGTKEEATKWVKDIAGGMAVGATINTVLFGAGKGIVGTGKFAASGAQAMGKVSFLSAFGVNTAKAIAGLKQKLKNTGDSFEGLRRRISGYTTPSGEKVLKSGDPLAKTSEKLASSLEAAGQKMGAFIDKATENNKSARPSVLFVARMIAKKVIDPLRKTGVPEDKTIVQNLEELVTTFVKDHGKGGKISMRQLQDFMVRFRKSAKVKFGSSDAAQQAKSEVVALYSKIVDAGMKNAEKSGVVPAGFRAAKTKYADLSNFAKAAAVSAEEVSKRGALGVLRDARIISGILTTVGVTTGGGSIATGLAAGAVVSHASKRAASVVAKMTEPALKEVNGQLVPIISKMGKFSKVLQKAASKGPKALIGTYILMSEKNKTFRDLARKNIAQQNKVKK